MNISTISGVEPQKRRNKRMQNKSIMDAIISGWEGNEPPAYKYYILYMRTGISRGWFGF